MGTQAARQAHLQNCASSASGPLWRHTLAMSTLRDKGTPTGAVLIKHSRIDCDPANASIDDAAVKASSLWQLVVAANAESVFL